MTNNKHFPLRKIFPLLLIFSMMFTLSSCSISQSLDRLSLYLDDLINEPVPVLQYNIQNSEPLSPVSYDDRHGYTLLNKEEKTIYDRINKAALSYNRYIDLRDKPIPINDFFRIYYYYLDDHPEVFWLNPHILNYYSDYSREKCTGINMQFIGKNNTDSYNNTIDKFNNKVSDDELNAMREEFDAKINQILQIVSPGENLLTRELKIYNYIAENVRYDMDLLNQIENNSIKRPIAQSAYGAAIEGHTVCSGYSKLFSILANAVGIECLIQYGQVDGEPHQWNVVCLDGKYYNVDVTNPITKTQNKTIINYTYFNITDQDIKRTHTLSPSCLVGSNFQVSYDVPPCSATENSFDTLFALNVSGDSFDPNDYQQKIAQLHAYNLTELYFRFPESSTQNTIQKYMDTHARQMKKLAASCFALDNSFYYLEPSRALITLERK